MAMSRAKNPPILSLDHVLDVSYVPASGRVSVAVQPRLELSVPVVSGHRLERDAHIGAVVRRVRMVRVGVLAEHRPGRLGEPPRGFRRVSGTCRA